MEDERHWGEADPVIRIAVVGEGPTEETFVRDVLALEFAPNNIFLYPLLISTSKGARGGALNYPRVLPFLRDTLHQRSFNYVTTLFDLYGLHSDFPGYAESRQFPDPLRRAEFLEQRFGEAVIAEAGVRADRFLPYIQPYEFEALLFTDIGTLTGLEPGWESSADALQAVRDQATSPEYINDGPTTHPSARLESLTPKYGKLRHGPRATKIIGLGRIEQACGHFGAWLQRLRSLPPLP